MLSSKREDDDEDDNHLCIKCNATVIGLDNYVKHRKERCSKNKYPPELKSTPTTSKVVTSISSLDPSYSLGADVFFQSLELQSSSKKNPLQAITPPIRLPKTSTSKSSVTPITSTAPRRISPGPSNRGEDWIGGHSLRIVSNEDNQTKLINAVANISGVVKKDVQSSSYNISSFNDYKADEDSNEESEESDEDDDDEQLPTGGKWKPPVNYTGGKWKPGGPDTAHHWSSQQLATPDPDDWDMRDEHTGGKWKPIMTQVDKLQEEDRDEDYDAPPPGHTKGKWVPGATQVDKTQIMQPLIHNKGSVQYWCGPCNRRLGSRVIYEKHLMSNLHLRKTLPENDLEYSGHMGPAKFSIEKRSPKPSQYINNTVYTQVYRRKLKSETGSGQGVRIKKFRNRRPYFVQCAGCKSRVRTHIMGKHLISHYHFRKATITGDVYKKLILDNILAIVHQSPFQCSPCKFYTNWLSYFMKHWFSDEHERKMNSIEGRFWCSFCKYECEKSEDMLHHMSSDEHGEVVSVINRSMPIIIRKKTIFSCNVCKMEFRYNVELKYHSKKTGHELPQSASDVYQELHKCQVCGISFKSSLTLAAHLKRKHHQDVFFCLSCELSFNTSDEAKKHRKSQEHRIRQKENIKERGQQIKDLSKKCPYCIPDRILKNVLELKEHIRREHPDTKRKCPKCGMAFILSQEVTHHIRNKACTFKEPSDDLDPMTRRMLWQCSQCLYKTDSQAECFFHEALHSTPLTTQSKTGEVLKYECPMCQKFFRKQSLIHHVRQHTLEKPYRCPTCGSNFARPSSLIQHAKLKHGQSVHETFSCDVCSGNFPTKQALARHCVIHGSTSSELCSQPGCSYSARSAYELRQHEATHGTERTHACSHPQCSYAAKTRPQLIKHSRIHGERSRKYSCHLCPFRTDQASHMKRHALCHAASKPYKCPHCFFTCSSLENLRKHVIKSNCHSGKCLYECRDCSDRGFSSNFASEFRSHLVQVHADKYNRKTAVDYVTKYCYDDKSVPLPEIAATVDKPAKDIAIDPEELIFTDIQTMAKIENYRVTENGTLEPYLDD